MLATNVFTEGAGRDPRNYAVSLIVHRGRERIQNTTGAKCFLISGCADIYMGKKPNTTLIFHVACYSMWHVCKYETKQNLASRLFCFFFCFVLCVTTQYTKGIGRRVVAPCQADGSEVGEERHRPRIVLHTVEVREALVSLSEVFTCNEGPFSLDPKFLFVPGTSDVLRTAVTGTEN